MALSRLYSSVKPTLRFLSSAKAKNVLSEKDAVDNNKIVPVRLLTKEDKPALSRFIRNVYHTQETTMMAAGFTEDDIGSVEEDIFKCVFYKDRICTFVAWDKDEIVGINLGTIMNKEEYDQWVRELTLDETHDTKSIQYMDFYRLAMGGVFELLPDGYTGNMRCMVEGCVAHEYRRHHLTRLMLNMGDERAHSVFNCRYSMSCVTSEMVTDMIENLSYKRMRRFYFEHYFVNGKRFFQTAIDKGVDHVDIMIGTTKEAAIKGKQHLESIGVKV